MTNRVGPVIMGHPTAREQLEELGSVLSFRTSDRTVGETHYRYERNGGKQGDCTIEKEYDYKVHPDDVELTVAYPMSGFESADAWREAIADVHGDADTEGYIYRIEVQE